MATSPFGDLDDEFAGAEAKAASAEKLQPPATYKFVILPFDAKGNQQMVEYDIFKANTGTHGVKFSLEILEPKVVTNEAGEEVATAGEIVEKVFWITANNLGYVKNDFEQILQAELPAKQKLSETLEKNTWAGRTFEGVLRNEKDNKGTMRNSVSFITAWSPEKSEGGEKKTEEKKAETAGGKKQTKF